ncbi:MAG: class I SAM-dependent methyltransferase [bacterium]|nr:class I SAM-dependent methyltransferase [bacterium]
MMRPRQFLARLKLLLRGDRPSAHVEEMQKLWNHLSRTSRLGFIAHLQHGQQWNEQEFQLVGERFVERIMDRFDEYAVHAAEQSTVLEIGCGVGRFSRPLAQHFKGVLGYDISAEMVEQARTRCGDLANVELRVNDGTALAGQPDASVEYCLCAGVFQHVTHVDVILGYIREALRVLVPGGLFLFQFEANRTAAVGRDQRGARISAGILDEALGGQAFRIRECSLDPRDPVRNLVIVLEKTDGEACTPQDSSFRNTALSERGWISGIYDGIGTQTTMHTRLKGEAVPMTFYDE